MGNSEFAEIIKAVLFFSCVQKQTEEHAIEMCIDSQTTGVSFSSIILLIIIFIMNLLCIPGIAYSNMMRQC